MKRFFAFLIFSSFSVFSNSTLANEWFNNVTVTQVGAYTGNNNHFVWLKQGVASECRNANPTNPVYNFSDATPGGKSILAMLLLAVVGQRTVHIQAQGCTIIELHLT